MVILALAANPQIKSARAHWNAAVHSIQQNYAPADPVFSYTNLDSATNGFSEASVHTIQVTQALQFPGKALLQADQARLTAEAAKLTYLATIRDIRAQVETGYYQLLLDESMADVTAENAANLRQVRQVTEVAYSASAATQADVIGAQFDLAAAQQQEKQLRTATTNDETALNQLLSRPPGAPLGVDRKLELAPLRARLDDLVDEAAHARQEILEAALAERNSNSALALARLEYFPDYSLSYIFDYFLLQSAAPANNRTQDHGWTIGFNMPIFFWLKQNEDVRKADFELDAARADLGTIRNQTAAAVTTLYRQAQLSYETAQLYRDALIPLARQGFQVALVAYQSGKVDFVTLSAALRRNYDARVAYLQAANQFLAGRVALEQAIGAPLPR